MNLRRVVLAIVLGIGMLATFLPWIHLPIIGAVYGAKGDGWITFALFAVALGVTVAWNRKDPLQGLPRIVMAAPAAGAAIFGAWKMIELHNKIEELGHGILGSALAQTVGIGPGIYLVLVAGLAAPAIAFAPGDGTKVFNR